MSIKSPVTEVFQPKDDTELRDAIKEYYALIKDKTENKKDYWNYWTKGKLNQWDVSKITDMSELFSSLRYFNEDISNWDVSNVTNMEMMFIDCKLFNQPLNSWGDKIKKVTNMDMMLCRCKSFNQPLDNWDVSNVTNMSGMFSGCSVFNQPLNAWGDKIGKVTDMSNMFSECETFEQPLDMWNISNVIKIDKMFEKTKGMSMTNQELRGAIDEYKLMDATMKKEYWKHWGKKDNWYLKIDRRINNFNVSKITDMSKLFKDINEFDEPLDQWKNKLNNVTTMSEMFAGCSIFNQPLEKWDVSRVTSMNGMFAGCSKFNQPLEKWDFSNVKSMNLMFDNCVSYNQSLINWDIVNVIDIKNLNLGSTNKITSMPSLKILRDSGITINPTLKDITFKKNVDDYTKIKDFLYTDNPYKIHIETFEHREFPIIVLPKGLVLYTYTYSKDSGYDAYNINRLHGRKYHSDLKFFFPIPYYALLVKPNYRTCIACVLTRDIRLFASTRPSPISRCDLRDGLENIGIQLQDKFYPYYKTGYTSSCPSFSFDPCISDELKQGLNVDGYIGVACMDSLNKLISMGDSYNMKVLKKIFGIGNPMTYKNTMYMNSHIGNDQIKIDHLDSTVGIPEIVLNLFDNKQFGEYTQLMGDKSRPTSVDDISKLNMNFKELFNCNIADVEKTISGLGDKIVFTKQAPILFHLHRDYIDKDSPYYKYIVPTIDDFKFPHDLDYTRDDGPAIELLAFNHPYLLNDIPHLHEPLRTGGELLQSRTSQLFLDTKKSIDSNIKVVPKKQVVTSVTPVTDLIMTETTQGIPIMMMMANPNQSGGNRRCTKKKHNPIRKKSRKHKRFYRCASNLIL